jgi:hypothetical protein
MRYIARIHPFFYACNKGYLFYCPFLSFAKLALGINLLVLGLKKVL